MVGSVVTALLTVGVEPSVAPGVGAGVDVKQMSSNGQVPSPPKPNPSSQHSLAETKATSALTTSGSLVHVPDTSTALCFVVGV